MVDKTNKHFNNNNQNEINDNNNGIDFTELDAKMEELVLTIKNFTINNIRNNNNIKEVKKQKKQVKKLDVDKIRKAIIEATEIAKKTNNNKNKND